MNHIHIGNLAEYTTKKELAQVLGINERRLYRLHEIARYTQFDDDYPLLNDEPDTRYPLTQYQCWVIYQILQISKRKNLKDFIEIPGIKIWSNIFLFLKKDNFNRLKKNDELHKQLTEY